MPKIFIPLNFSNSNLTLDTMDLENVEDFEDFLGGNCGANEIEAKSPSMVVRKYFTFINL